MRAKLFTGEHPRLQLGDGLWAFELPAFRIYGIDPLTGQIHEIEAMGVLLPYGSKSGWE